jgi:two-component system, NarL family, sensor kinase
MVVRHTASLVFLFLVQLVFFNAASAQRTRIDSLREITTAHPGDTLAMLAYAELCYEYRFVDQDSSLMFADKGIELGKKLNFKTGLAQVYSDAAFVHFDKGDFSKASNLWISALDIRSELRDTARVASLQMKLGGAQFRMGNYEEALRYQLAALRSYEAMHITTGVAQAYNNVAAVYEHQNHLDKALEYYGYALAIHKAAKNEVEAGTTLINIGNIHFRKKDFSQAKLFYMAAMPVFEAGSGSASHYLAMCLNNLSEIYVLTDKYDSALVFSQKALTLRKKIRDYQGTVSSLNMMGRIYSKLRRYKEAEMYLLAALDSSSRKGILPEKGKVHLSLYELYRQKSDWKRGLDSYVDYSIIKDSLMNESGRKEIADLQVKYETEKKEQQIALQESALSEKETRIQRDYIIIIGLALTLLLLTVIFVLLRNRQVRKAEVAKKESEISVREAYIKASIESQENERKRFARDLHDGMGQWISSLRLILNQIHSAPTDEKKLEALGKSDRIMEEMNREFRSIAFNLMPQTLIQSGLRAAIDEMAARLNTTGKVHFTVAAFNFPSRLIELEEISLYRIVQEWTNNILKYAGATEVSIQLVGHDDENVIMIEDNGTGFDPAGLAIAPGNGWKNIRSRINLVNGAVDVDSSPEQAGTTFTLTIPTKTTVEISEELIGSK